MPLCLPPKLPHEHQLVDVWRDVPEVQICRVGVAVVERPAAHRRAKRVLARKVIHCDLTVAEKLHALVPSLLLPEGISGGGISGILSMRSRHPSLKEWGKTVQIIKVHGDNKTDSHFLIFSSMVSMAFGLSFSDFLGWKTDCRARRTDTTISMQQSQTLFQTLLQPPMCTDLLLIVVVERLGLASWHHRGRDERGDVLPSGRLLPTRRWGRCDRAGGGMRSCASVICWGYYK